MKECTETKIVKLETNLTNMKNKIDEISSNQNTLGEKFDDFKDEIIKSLSELPEKLDKRYASKDTEDTVKKITWLIVSAVIVALISLVIKT